MWFEKLFNKYHEAIILVTGIYGKDPVHGWPHILRVLNNEELIMTNEFPSEKIKYDVLFLATIFHDTGRILENNLNIHHAIISARIASIYLRKLWRDEVKISEVTHAILSHSYTLGIPAKTIEAKILSDADKLDALGAIGLYRVIIEGDRKGRDIEGTIHHIAKKLIKLPNLMYTRYARQLAIKRVQVLMDFISHAKTEQLKNSPAN